MKNEELKQICNAKNLKCALRKTEMIQAIIEANNPPPAEEEEMYSEYSANRGEMDVQTKN